MPTYKVILRNSEFAIIEVEANNLKDLKERIEYGDESITSKAEIQVAHQVRSWELIGAKEVSTCL